MNLQVTWATERGKQRRGHVTQDELPATCDRATPLVVGEDGNAVVPSDLEDVVLQVTSPWTEDGERLARLAQNAGYKIDWFKAS
jgi:hypothetical protein